MKSPPRAKNFSFGEPLKKKGEENPRENPFRNPNRGEKQREMKNREIPVPLVKISNNHFIEFQPFLKRVDIK